MKRFLPYIVTCFSVCIFLILKISTLSFRFGDGNAYMYMADGFFKGIIPYRDYFLADPPFFILLLSVFRLLIGAHIYLFQLVPLLFEAGNAILLFLILRKQHARFSYLAPFVYLATFTVLATSDYITGVQGAVFFFLFGVWFFENKKNKWAGVMFAFSCLIKLYMVPAYMGILAYLFFKKEFVSIRNILFGSIIAGTGICLPFLIISPTHFFGYLIAHQMNRPEGIGKLSTVFLFVKSEWFLIILSIGAVFKNRKHLLVLPFISLILFFAFYPDLYYLYLDSLMPFLVVFSILGVEDWFHTKKQVVILMGILYYFFVVVSFVSYFDMTQKGRFLNAPEIAAYMATQKNYYLYGSHEVAPLVALLSGKKLLPGYVDTNSQSFVSGAQSKKTATDKVLEQGAYLLFRASENKDGTLTLNQQSEIFEDQALSRYCRREKTFPSTSYQEDQYIVIYRCKK